MGVGPAKLIGTGLRVVSVNEDLSRLAAILTPCLTAIDFARAAVQ
jgi:hypothetical protein